MAFDKELMINNVAYNYAMHHSGYATYAPIRCTPYAYGHRLAW